jgi:anti-sigma-K factor RskA
LLVAVVLVQRSDQGAHKTAVLAGAGETRITVDIVGDEMSLAAADLPVLDADHEYQLWLIDADAEVRSAGVFAPHDDGTFDGRMPIEVEDAEALAITVEPLGGSEQATTPIVYQGELG